MAKAKRKPAASSKKTHVIDKVAPNAGDTLYYEETKSGNSRNEVDWEASEYIHHEKDVTWYLGLLGIALLIGAILYLIVGDLWSLATLAVMTAAVMVYANRKPDTLKYHLSLDGLEIGQRQFFLEEFRSFSLIVDGGVNSITLAPLKRFMTPISLYYTPEDEGAIINILSSVLPHEDSELDFVDRLIRKVRF